MTRTDGALLAAVCLLLFGVPIALNRNLSTHEAVHGQNVREMIADGDYVIPHYGGRAWLERPPLPHWLTLVPARLFGVDSPWAYRIAPACAGFTIVLLVAGLAAKFHGRAVGLLAGASLASMREFLNYSVGPECDIFLALIVAGAMVSFARAEIGTARPTAWSPFGFRSWPVLAFFVLLGLANVAKGLFFGSVLIAGPVGLFVLLNASLRRWLWLPGIVAFLAVGGSWALAAYLRQPDIVELWASDYLGRIKPGYMTESRFYYFLHLPWLLFPWTVAATVGVVKAVRVARRDRGSLESFLLLWAVGDLLILTVPQGKHHHYYLHAIAPWAIFAAIGYRPLWNAITPAAWHGDDGFRRGVVGLVVAILAGHVVVQVVEKYRDPYVFDRAFAGRVTEMIRGGEPVAVLNDLHPLDSSWMLFHLPVTTPFLHNATYLLDDRLPDDRLLVVAKGYQRTDLEVHGTVTITDRSERARGRTNGPECWTLFEIRLPTGRPRAKIKPSITALQATGRAAGPFLVAE
jgi:4-amino-4-deoxy-L-arabinose transferase-like glycosyltransferase